MALFKSTGTFLASTARSFGTDEITVVHQSGQDDEKRIEIEAHVQATHAFFEVDAPVYEGDELLLPDPRGGTRTVYVTKVEINKAGGGMSSSLSHIDATFSDRAPRPRASAGNTGQVVHGNAIIVSGSHVNIALGNGTINHNNAVTEGYEDLAKAVKAALELLEHSPGIDEDERTAAQDSAAEVLKEIVKPEPDKGTVKRSLALMRGVLQSAAQSGAAAAAAGLVAQLFI
jgi:hypothetical protein